jgi:uncharacterized protein (DUF885 family)
MRHHLIGVLTIAFLALAAHVSSSQSSAQTSFRAFLDEDWKYWMAQYPETATLLGYPGHDDKWTDYSPQAIAAREAHLAGVLAKLKGMNRGSLAAADQLDYDLYLDIVSTAIDGLKFGYDAMPIKGVIPRDLRMPINQMEGLPQDVLRVFSAMPARTTAEYERIITRLRTLPALVDQTIALMRAGMTKGATPPRITMRDVAAQVAGQVVAKPLDSPLLAAFMKFPATVPAGDRDRLTRAAVDAYEKETRPAFDRLRTFIADTYLPACRESVSASALPDGAAMYAHNVRWHVTTPATPKEIHAIGLAEVKRIRGEMDEVMKRAGFTGGYDKFKQFLRTDPRFYYTDAESLLTGYRDISKRADPELARLFVVLPRNPYGVVKMADAVAPSQTTAYYEPGSLAAGRPGNMHANTYKLDARPKWEMEALTLHEAVPGHHLQIALAQELEGLPEFRKNSSYTAFVEGWALYSESLGEAMGFYTDPYSKFGQLTYDMWRAVRLVVDTGLHSMRWTRQQAIDFFAENAAKTLQDITVEVDRYIVWPGQALGYKMGQIKIQELRRGVEKRLGDKFDVRAFHDVILRQGAVPMDVLERHVEAWVAAQ